MLETVRHAWRFATWHRRARKRDFRKLWITRINAGARQHGVTYSKLINALKNKDIQIDRKVLADLAMNEPAGFKAVIDATR